MYRKKIQKQFKSTRLKKNWCQHNFNKPNLEICVVKDGVIFHQENIPKNLAYTYTLQACLKIFLQIFNKNVNFSKNVIIRFIQKVN